MATSLIVKRALSTALKELMLTKPITDIRIQELTNACDLSRHTFYNHFHDIYELLEWTYQYEVIENLDLYCNTKEWKTAICLVLNYTYKNKKICLNTFNSLGRDHLEDFLFKTFIK